MENIVNIDQSWTTLDWYNGQGEWVSKWVGERVWVTLSLTDEIMSEINLI